jgi:surface antigen
MPGWGWSARGNANQWDDNARAAGIPVDGSPRAGDVAISNSGFYGHAMYVESVNGDGTINISQYNANLDGRYSVRYNLNPAGLVFIHFP